MIPCEHTQGVQALTLTKLPTHSMSIMSSVLMFYNVFGTDVLCPQVPFGIHSRMEKVSIFVLVPD
jgi:hypothetical protein